MVHSTSCSSTGHFLGVEILDLLPRFRNIRLVSEHLRNLGKSPDLPKQTPESRWGYRSMKPQSVAIESHIGRRLTGVQAWNSRLPRKKLRYAIRVVSPSVDPLHLQKGFQVEPFDLCLNRHRLSKDSD